MRTTFRLESRYSSCSSNEKRFHFVPTLSRFIPLCALMLVPAAATTHAAEQYILQLDTGGHQAAIKDIALVENGQQIVSAGDDKVIRVWDRRTGKTLRTIRGYVQPGQYGKNYAMAVSPDGKWLAAAGWMDDTEALEPCCGDIRLFELATGKLVALLKAHTNAVYDLAFSENSRMLVSGGADNIAVVWDVPKQQELARLEDANGHKDRIVRVEFTDNGRQVVTAGYDGKVKLWSVSDKTWLRDLTTHKSRVYGLAVSKDGQAIASGDADGEIRLWNTGSASSRVLANQGVSIGALSFSPDGKKLLSTCGYRCPEHPGQAVWDTATGKELQRYLAHDGSVSVGTFSADGKFAATAGGDNHEIHIWDAETGKAESVLKGSGKTVTSVALSSKKDLLAWGTVDPCPEKPICPNVPGKLEFELGLPTEGRALEPPRASSADGASFLRAKDQMGPTQLSLETGGHYGRTDAVLKIRRNKKDGARLVRDQTNGFGHTSFTLVENGATLISGGEHGALASYKTDGGKPLKDFVGHTEIVYAMAASADSQLLATGGADQTVRLWNIKTGELIVSMLHTTDGEWVMWTEQGYYAASPNGDKLVGWQVNQGPDKEARYVTARQLKEQLLSPEIIRRAIILGSAEKAIQQLRKSGKSLNALLAVEPPSFEIASPSDGTAVSRNSVTLTLTMPTGSARPTRIEAIANIRNVTPPDLAIGSDASEVTFRVPLRAGDNKIRVIAYNDAGYTAERQITISNLNDGKPDNPGKLYVVAIGVNDYPKLPKNCTGPGGTCDLRFAVKDARAFHESIVKTVAPRYDAVRGLLLVNGAKKSVTETSSIEAAGTQTIAEEEPLTGTIQHKIKEFLASTTADDMTVFFLAGHGVNIGEDYYFLPTNASMQGESEFDQKTLVSWRAIQKMLHSARGTRLMFLDTCHSGNAYNARLEKDGGDANIIVFSATKANSISKELDKIEHGAFTYSMLNGLQGKADHDKNQTVELLEFGSFTSSEVKRLTKNAQTPVLYSSGVEDFVLAWP